MNSTEATPPGNGTDLAKHLTYHVFIPILLTLCLVSALCNLVVLLSLRWLRRTMSPTLCFSVSLAVADTVSSVLMGVGLVVNSYLPEVHGVRLPSICYALIFEAFRLGCIIISALHLLALAVNHYVGIVRPLHYAATVTRKTAYFTMVTIWICPIAFFIFYFASVPGQGFLSPNCSVITFMFHRTFRWIVSLLFFTPLVIMTAMYARIFFVVRQHQRGLVEYPMSSHQLKKNVKAIVTTLLILGTYLLGLMPAVISFALTCGDCPVPITTLSTAVAYSILISVNTLVVLKALTNPAIYAARMPEIRGALHMTRCWLTGSPCVYPDSLLSRTETMSSSVRMYSLRSNRKFVSNPTLGQNLRAGTPSSCGSVVSGVRGLGQNDRSVHDDLLPSTNVQVVF